MYNIIDFRPVFDVYVSVVLFINQVHHDILNPPTDIFELSLLFFKEKIHN